VFGGNMSVRSEFLNVLERSNGDWQYYNIVENTGLKFLNVLEHHSRLSNVRLKIAFTKPKKIKLRC
jgi:hypothetical protein